MSATTRVTATNVRLGVAAIALTLAGCGSAPGSSTATSPPASGSLAPSPAGTMPIPPARTLIVDTDVAPDDLVALAFLAGSPNVTIAAITVSGTGEAHCGKGVDVVLRLLERLEAPDIPVACGRETPLAGTHAFPDLWRAGADAGSGLTLPPTSRTPFGGDAVALISEVDTAVPEVTVLTLGPLTNLADALQSDAALAGRLGAVFVMGGAVHVPGNLVGPDAPTGNSVAEWNIYVDPTAAQVVIDAGVDVDFVSLDGTNQVPLTRAFADRVQAEATGAGARVLADLLVANPFMASGDYYLWDSLAAELAAGYAVGTFEPVAIAVELAEGPESGFTRPTSGSPNAGYLSEADGTAAEDVLLEVLNGL